MSESDSPPPINTELYSPWPDSDLYRVLGGLELNLALSALSERSRRILEQKYGLVDGVPKSRKQIATQENIPPGRVGIILRQSLGRISLLSAERVDDAQASL